MARKASTSTPVKRSGGSNGSILSSMPPISEQAVRDLSQVFKLLSDETRLRILLYLAQSGELHVTDICKRLGQSQPAVSHHLALLRVSGLIESRREGKHNFYSVRAEFFGELLVDLLSATGDMPKKVKFQQFVLSHEGD
ncbi:MAG: putative transcriptional regulator [Planctomycetota bacterium]|nr:putative transcriptional regulator [Planctomycetota bacterium]